MISVLEATNELHAVGQDGSILGVAIDGTQRQLHIYHRRSRSCLSQTFGCPLGKLRPFFADILGNLPIDLIHQKIRSQVTSLSMSNPSNNARPSLRLKPEQEKQVYRIGGNLNRRLDESGSSSSPCEFVLAHNLAPSIFSVQPNVALKRRGQYSTKMYDSNVLKCHRFLYEVSD